LIAFKSLTLSFTYQLALLTLGELKGYWEMYQKHGGGVPWARLVQPTIDLCENGFQVSRHAANALDEHANRIKNTPSMAEIFIDNSTGMLALWATLIDKYNSLFFKSTDSNLTSF
jgi:gamma-glutamyltranspeptidase/glutathione hydrolase/leukotriene-C4 hydrolase